MKDAINIKIVDHQSSAYNQLVEIRSEILRKPLGLSFTEEELTKEHNQIHVGIFLNNKIVGGLASIPNEKHLKIRQVCISNDHQKQGLGKELTNYVIDYANRKAYDQIYCHARKEAIPFYESLNFTPYGDSFIEVRIPHLLMKLNLVH